MSEDSSAANDPVSSNPADTWRKVAEAVETATTFGPAAAATWVDGFEPQAAWNSAVLIRNKPVRNKVMSLIWISSLVSFRGRRPS